MHWHCILCVLCFVCLKEKEAFAVLYSIICAPREQVDIPQGAELISTDTG